VDFRPLRKEVDRLGTDTRGYVGAEEEEADQVLLSEFQAAEAFERAVETVALMWSGAAGEAIPKGKVKEILLQAWAAQGELFDAAAARQWAVGPDGAPFAFTAEMRTRDGVELASLGGDLEQLAVRRQNVLRPSRLNAERVELGIESLRDAADAGRARTIAAEGMRLFVAEGFLPCSVCASTSAGGV
jgi:hypothetical protein